MRREVTTLQRGDEVVFFIDNHGWGKKYAQIGRVWAVYVNSRKIDIHWLNGYKDQHDEVPFKDVVAAANKSGTFFHFGSVVGRSDILTDKGKSEWFDKKAEELWESLTDVPMNPETEQIEESWQHFPEGTDREKIWKWFDEIYSGGVAELLNGGKNDE